MLKKMIALVVSAAILASCSNDQPLPTQFDVTVPLYVAGGNGGPSSEHTSRVMRKYWLSRPVRRTRRIPGRRGKPSSVSTETPYSSS